MKDEHTEDKGEGIIVLTDTEFPGRVGVKITVEKIEIQGEPHWLWEFCLKTEETFHDHKSWITVFNVASEAEMEEYANEQKVLLN